MRATVAGQTPAVERLVNGAQAPEPATATSGPVPESAAF
jgi:hypothetical protein